MFGSRKDNTVVVLNLPRRMKLATLLLFLTVTAFGIDPIPRTGGLVNGHFWTPDDSLKKGLQLGYLMGLSEGTRNTSLGYSMFGDSTFKEIVDGVDDFYSDPANVLIPVRDAMRYFQLKLNGASAEKLAETLALFRRVAAAEPHEP
jgi:hypothetical protein